MGLDMYLTKRRRDTDDELRLVAYWRKANHIHGRFERNASDGYIENCELYPVSKEDLARLMSDCRLALDDPRRAESVLPREEGFFFGSTRYDEGYFGSLRATIEQLRRVIDETADDEQLFYHAWW
ncbi:hypothetical protein [Adlercreutzia sp. ZJ473]|uniref:hypothetical protein n=1 Tax=Adlercreutzia sp. ZJ473 TaxID=2722822 RepID=UPI0015549D46|nr:hypothetical protein [Adlercreutzia sp. ZJ473]